MIPVVVFVLGLVTSGLSLPLTTEQQISTGYEIPQFPKQTPVNEFSEKTAVDHSPEVYSPAEKVQSNPPVPKVENVPIKVEKPQNSYPPNPVLLPIQPLAVVPVGHVDSVLQPVVVPAEAITPGRIFKTGIPVQQGGFSEDIIITGNSVPFEEVAHPVMYIPVQTQGAEQIQPSTYVQRHEEQTPTQQENVPTGQQYTPTQSQSNPEPLVKEQQVVQSHIVPQNVEQVQNYNPVPVDINTQVYNAPQSVHPEIVQSAEKNVPYQGEGSFVPIQVIQQSIQQVEEKQKVESDIKPVVTENVEKHVQQQQPTETQEQVYNVQQAEKQGEYQQVYNVQQAEKQGEYQQVYNVQQAENQGEYQQVYNVQQAEKQREYQQVNPETPVQNWPVNQQIHITQPIVEKQVECQQAHPEKTVQNWPVEQQIHNTQLVVEKQVEYQQVNPQTPVQNSPVEHQVYSTQPAAERQEERQKVHPEMQNQSAEQQVYNTQPVVEKQGVYQTGVTQTQQQQVQITQQRE